MQTTQPNILVASVGLAVNMSATRLAERAWSRLAGQHPARRDRSTLGSALVYGMVLGALTSVSGLLATRSTTSLVQRARSGAVT